MGDVRILRAIKSYLDLIGVSGHGDKSVRVRRTGTLSIPDAGGGTVVTWQAEDYDTDTMFPGTGTNITVKTAGKWLLQAAVRWEDQGLAGQRQLEFLKGGTAFAADRYIQAAAGGQHIHNISAVLDLAVNDIITLRAFQNSSSALLLEVLANISPVMTMHLLSTP